MKTLCITTLLSVCTTFSCLAYSPLESLPKGHRAGLLVERLDKPQVLLTTNNNTQYFPPASTLKIVTALAAKLELGDNFRFTTTIGKADKDVVIRFSGDPTLTTAALKQLLISAQQQGLKKIEGDLWLDNSAFTGYDRAVGWPWDILGVCYSAPASAITLDENCVQASIYTEANQKTRVYVPEHFPIYASTSAISVTKTEQEATQCDLGLISSPDNHYQLQGCLVERSKPLPLKFAVQSPELYAQRMLHTLLTQLNLELEGNIRVGKPKLDNQILAEHHSVSLLPMLDEMLKRSDNLIADNLTKTIGSQFFIQPGSFSNGTKAIKQIIFAHTGVDLSDTPLADGSGLSRNNRFSSGDMAKILRYIWQNDEQLNLVALLPKSGESGTLKYRRSMRKSPVKGAIIGKSGSLYGSYNMAGFGTDASGEPKTLFVQFVTDYHQAKEKSEGKPTVAPITQFETLFYKDVISFSQAIPKK
ncbi:serine-type D-Ala-D-Ala carboxypeptidase [Vibrio sp. MarTm2]|uniref:serine-type D-Ala-D-Ala carboxypeptidase n=1 Tax=Vibrio sp. MarTm2 TaxID=2998831 RepID=UPI0022CDB484|nr:serine-type D-Ala-D-Ala carboxypeptidase [Vibrio sp. MarTm2]MDA0129773.1 serine-type D-Ala-D-Ala carboxypeptidase [Vibrio sp. MarTm2]